MSTKSGSKKLPPSFTRNALLETEPVEYLGGYHKPATLVIEFIRDGDPLIMGARMYNAQQRYIGWWPSFNIPRAVLLDFANRISHDELKVRTVFAETRDGVDSLEHL